MQVKRIGWVLLLVIVICSCNKDDDISIMDYSVCIQGTIRHQLTNEPIAGIEIQSSLHRKFDTTVISDAQGKYEILYNDFRALLQADGLSETEIDTLFSQGGISLRVFPIVDYCSWMPIDPDFLMYRTQDIDQFPSSSTQDYYLLEGESVSFRFLDTSTVASNFKWNANLRLRDLGFDTPYARWNPLELELFGNDIAVRCLPLDRPIEVEVDFKEYDPEDYSNLITDYTIRDTLLLEDIIDAEVIFEY